MTRFPYATGRSLVGQAADLRRRSRTTTAAAARAAAWRLEEPARPLVDAQHVPVLVEETLGVLLSAPAGVIVDGTVGLGGHAAAILSRTAADTLLVGFDRDQEALDVARARLASFGDRVRLVHADYADMEAHLPAADRDAVVGVLIDAGLSSLQIDRASRGFSFDQDGPLDMRADATAPRDAADVLNDEPEEELTRILTEYGEVPRAWEVSRALLRARHRARLATTHDVVRAIRRELSPRFPRRSLARVFQAVRIEVNDELGRLRRGLRAAERVLRAGGVLAVISYHSLEDREVKQFLRERAVGDAPLWDVLTRHVVRPGRPEVEANPRARSARLRAARRTSHDTR